MEEQNHIKDQLAKIVVELVKVCKFMFFFMFIVLKFTGGTKRNGNRDQTKFIFIAYSLLFVVASCLNIVSF